MMDILVIKEKTVAALILCSNKHNARILKKFQKETLMLFPQNVNIDSGSIRRKKKQPILQQIET